MWDTAQLPDVWLSLSWSLVVNGWPRCPEKESPAVPRINIKYKRILPARFEILNRKSEYNV